MIYDFVLKANHNNRIALVLASSQKQANIE